MVLSPQRGQEGVKKCWGQPTAANGFTDKQGLKNGRLWQSLIFSHLPDDWLLEVRARSLHIDAYPPRLASEFLPALLAFEADFHFMPPVPGPTVRESSKRGLDPLFSLPDADEPQPKGGDRGRWRMRRVEAETACSRARL